MPLEAIWSQAGLSAVYLLIERPERALTARGDPARGDNSVSLVN